MPYRNIYTALKICSYCHDVSSSFLVSQMAWGCMCGCSSNTGVVPAGTRFALGESLGEKGCQEICIHGDMILDGAHFFLEILYFVFK